MVPPIDPTRPPINLEFLSLVLSWLLLEAEVGTATTVVIVVSGWTITDVRAV